MKAKSKIVRRSLLTIGLIALMGMAGNASAANACKGLESDACSANASCGWVNGYERKDGRKVKSFCRTKSVRAKAAKAKDSTAKQAVK